MSDEDFKALSALLDGELDGDGSSNALRKLGRDEGHKAYWERQHLARDALQGQLSPTLDADFASRVAAAIDDEPAILAPRPREAENAAPAPARRFTRPLAGLAIAATVAAVSVVALQLLEPGGGVPGISPIAQQSGGSITLPAGSSPAQLVATPGTHWVAPQQAQRDRELEQRLNMYLSDHMEHATIGKVHGMLPYSRLVGYDSVQ